MDFALTLLNWFRQNGRSLPWRETRNPYAIWLSEIILQQTRIEQGLPYWERFMHRWPTVESLAAATEDEVLRQWQGLGYYSRARNLHEAAQQIVAQGVFPRTMEGLKALKGVGDYTAAAIGSIAFDLPVAVVDGNVYRLLARHYGIETPINTTEGKKEFAQLAQSLLPVNAASVFNQAMMDFGSIQCTPQQPQCYTCPLLESCIAMRDGRVGELPVRRNTLKVKERYLTFVYVRYNGQTCIHRRPAGDIWQGLYEPLCLERSQVESSVSSARTTIGEMMQAQGVFLPLTATPILLMSNVKHVLTHRIIYADFWLWETDACPALPDNYFWIDETDIDQYGVPRLVELLLTHL